jgi:hypothetical protein
LPAEEGKYFHPREVAPSQVIVGHGA